MEPIAYDEMYQLEETHWWYQGMRHITSGLLTPVLNNHRNFLILDAGCGTGFNIQVLERFGHTLGVDYSPIALRYASKRGSKNLVQADVTCLPYGDNIFDLVTSLDVLYAEEVDNDVAALSEFARIVRSDGYVLIRVPALPSLRGSHDTLVHGVRRYTATELTQKFLTAGLRPLRITYSNTILLPFVFLTRLLQLREVGKSDVTPTPKLMNTFLFNILKLESYWINQLQKSLPLGVSLFGLAKKEM